jgi:hypothetical protein
MACISRGEGVGLARELAVNLDAIMRAANQRDPLRVRPTASERASLQALPGERITVFVVRANKDAGLRRYGGSGKVLGDDALSCLGLGLHNLSPVVSSSICAAV